MNVRILLENGLSEPLNTEGRTVGICVQVHLYTVYFGMDAKPLVQAGCTWQDEGQAHVHFYRL